MSQLSTQTWLNRFLIAFKDELISAFQPSDIGEEIRHAILPWKDTFSFGNIEILLTDAIIVAWIAAIPTIIFWVWIASKRDYIPKGRQVVGESIVGLFTSICKNSGMNDKQAAEVVPMIGTVCFFLLSCNLVAAFRIAPPAKNLAFPIGLALFTIAYIIFTSIRFVGIKGFWGSLIHPTPVMLPFKILDYFIKPVSLSLRLFGNIFGAFILMEFLYLVLPLILPGIFGMWFDLADALLQASIFTYLTALYIGEIVEGAEARQEALKKKKVIATT